MQSRLLFCPKTEGRLCLGKTKKAAVYFDFRLACIIFAGDSGVTVSRSRMVSNRESG
jgi:hypothetical protein